MAASSLNAINVPLAENALLQQLSRYGRFEQEDLVMGRGYLWFVDGTLTYRQSGAIKVGHAQPAIVLGWF